MLLYEAGLGEVYNHHAGHDQRNKNALSSQMVN